MTEQTNLPRLTDVIQLPKDTTEDATVLSVTQETWTQHLNEEQVKKFKDPDVMQVFVKYETQESGFVGEDSLRHYEKPTSGTKLGKYLNKYGDFEVGQQIKILWDGNSKPSIML